MVFGDWVNFVNNGVGIPINWAGYNRQTFQANVQMQQIQKYQEKNYKIAWVAIARDDLRSMMGISVNRLNNNMVVATLILGMAGGAVVSVDLGDQCDDFLMYGFYLSSAHSIIYLTLSILLTVKGQNSAFTNTMKLLTFEIRPENPSTYSHDYMKQSTWIEKQGLLALYRWPGLEQYQHVPGAGGHERAPGPKASGAASSSRRFGIKSEWVGAAGEVALETLEVASTHTWYLTKFARFMDLWQPYDIWSRYCLGLGVITLLQGCVYYALGKCLTSEESINRWAEVAVALPYVFLVVLVVLTVFRETLGGETLVFLVVLAGSPVAATTAVAAHEKMNQAFYILTCYSCHLIFWCLTFFLVGHLHQGENNPFASDDAGFWKKAHGTAPKAKHTSRAPSADASSDSSSNSLDQSASPSDNAFGFHGNQNNATKGNSNTCLTDSKAFEGKIAIVEDAVAKSIRITLFATACMWFFMCVWATVACELDSMSVLLSGFATVQSVQVAWPDPLFWPHRMACDGNLRHVFLANEFRIYRATRDAVSNRLIDPTAIECSSIAAEIIDITTHCNATACWPLALVANNVSFVDIVDCNRGTVQSFSIFTDSIEFGALDQSSNNLLVGSGNGLMMYGPARDGYRDPLYDITVEKAIAGVDIAGKWAYFFRTVRKGVFTRAVEVRDAESLDLEGQWGVSSYIMPLRAGCGATSGNEALVLSVSPTFGSEWRLFQLKSPVL